MWILRHLNRSTKHIYIKIRSVKIILISNEATLSMPRSFVCVREYSSLHQAVVHYLLGTKNVSVVNFQHFLDSKFL